MADGSKAARITEAARAILHEVIDEMAPGSTLRDIDAQYGQEPPNSSLSTITTLAPRARYAAAWPALTGAR